MDSVEDGEQVSPNVEVPLPTGDFKMPSLEELLDALNHMEGMTEDEKEKLRNNLLVENREFGGVVSEASKQLPGNSSQLLTLLLLLSVVAVIFGKVKIISIVNISLKNRNLVNELSNLIQISHQNMIQFLGTI